MGSLIVGVVAFIIIASIVINILGDAKMSLEKIISALIIGAIGFAIGNYFSQGWSIFGAILGGLVGLSYEDKE